LRLVDTARFDYHLPPQAIAQVPADRRDDARLLLVDRGREAVSHHHIRDLPELLADPTALIRNNARVLRARLRGQRAGGGQVECLLLRPAAEPDTWWCLLRPGKRLPVGSHFTLGASAGATVLEKSAEAEYRVGFALNGAGTVLDLAEQAGEMPLPPYIRREPGDARTSLDAERYNTVYADPTRTVAAAAPTAGLHFTPELIARLEGAGHRFFDLTLHVGLDTFRPIATEQIEDHRMHTETYEVPLDTAALLRGTAPPRRLAVGTTSLRAAEDFVRHHRETADPARPHLAAAGLFIHPPAQFGVEALLTNFHLPRSTLLCLVSAFLTPGSERGIDWLHEIYREALAHDYRFYSYGDAMLIL
jgi:S-adenosylmethionine:tRNA ribosyltransferase-isomerase